MQEKDAKKFDSPVVSRVQNLEGTSTAEGTLEKNASSRKSLFTKSSKRGRGKDFISANRNVRTSKLER